MPTPTERPGATHVVARAQATVVLDDPDVIDGEHGGPMFTDGVLIVYSREVAHAGHATDERDSGWTVTARVFGAKVAKRRNPDGTLRPLSSHGQQTFIEGEDVFPDWLSQIAQTYHPEHA